MKKKNYGIAIAFSIILIVAGGIVYYFFPIFWLIGGLTYQNVILDGLKIYGSKYEGYTLTVSPSTKLGRLSNYGGSRDKYHYLLPDYTDVYPNISERLSDIIDIKKPTEFKVTRVERSVSGFNMNTLCILEDTKELDLKFAEECSDLEKIKIISVFFDQLREKLKSQPFALVGLSRPMNGETFDFEINDVALMKIASEAELIKKLCKIDNQIPKIFSMLEADKLFLAESPLRESDFYKWARLAEIDFFDKDTVDIIFNNRKLPNEVLMSIQENEPNSIVNRWIFTQYFIAAKNKQFSNNCYQGLKSKYQGSDSNFINTYNQFKIESLKHGFESSPKPNGINCSWMVPPKVFGDFKIVEGLI